MALKEKKEIRLNFIKFQQVYSEFNDFIKTLGFRSGHYWSESSTVNDYNYSHYKKQIDSLWGVEHYINDELSLSFRFLRDRNEHKFMIVDGGAYSDVYLIDRFKEIILNSVIEVRDIKLKELEKYKNL